ncbi:MAG: type II toxin-antitoxin system VapC family toxin [Rhodocyclaceae bacterium]
MISYFDTSALFKLFVAEAGREETLQLRDASDHLATVLIAHTEMQATFARRMREDPATSDSLKLDRQAFLDDWPRWLVVPVDPPLVELAGRYAALFSLRAYDSVHLAAAQVLRQQTGMEITFACFDHRLNDAADLLGFATPFLKA